MLLFVPMWRTPRVLDTPLAELGEENFPKTEYQFRWRQVETTKEENVAPMDLLYRSKELWE